MNIKRFFGKNSREALAMVRQALGENAIILSNRQVNGGNEIMAFKEEDMQEAAKPMHEDSVHREALSHALDDMTSREMASREVASRDMSNRDMSRRRMSAQEMEQGMMQERHQDMADNEPVPLLTMLKKNNRLHGDAAPTGREEFAMREAPMPATRPNHVVMDSVMQPAAIQSNRGISAKPSTTASPVNFSAQQLAEMMAEMRTMRQAIEAQLTTLSWGNIQQREPEKAEILSKMIDAGFSPALSRYLSEKLPPNLNSERSLMWIRSILAKNLNTVETESALLDQGGVFALIGPTGVGKTTTTAKLAARYVMKHGTHNLGLITTDAYRIGGHEQLRIYGKILGVMVHAVKDEADLHIALQELKNKHTILIDTVGVSQRDRMVSEQIAMLSNSKTPIKKLLCLNATNTGETLTDVIRAYQGRGLDGCIATKVDEAATIGSTLDVIIREKLRLYYVANGQRVPEDIHLANKHKLIEHAFKLGEKKNTPFQFQHDDLPFLMGNTPNGRDASLGEIQYV